MTNGLALTPGELAELHSLLAAHLPDDVRVGIFGSRAGLPASAAPKPWSDLDLVLEGPAALPLSLLATLAEAFDESPLPWKVDLVDRLGVSDAFGQIIDATARPLPAVVKP